MNESQLRIYAEKRLKLPPAAGLALGTFIPTALNNLARDVANDYTKRRLLLTDKAVVTSTISGANSAYYTDLDTIISTYGVMVDYLQYGTVYWILTPKTFVASDVNTGNDRITIANHGMVDGTRVWLSSTLTLPAPLVISTSYYVFAVSSGIISLCATYADAIARTNVIDLTTAGSGTMTVTPQDFETLQWFDDAEFASLERGLPVELVYGWMVKNRLYISGATSGTLSYAVPFIPLTIDDVPSQLDTDMIDQLVSVAVSGGVEEIEPDTK